MHVRGLLKVPTEVADADIMEDIYDLKKFGRPGHQVPKLDAAVVLVAAVAVAFFFMGVLHHRVTQDPAKVLDVLKFGLV